MNRPGISHQDAKHGGDSEQHPCRCLDLSGIPRCRAARCSGPSTRPPRKPRASSIHDSSIEWINLAVAIVVTCFSDGHPAQGEIGTDRERGAHQDGPHRQVQGSGLDEPHLRPRLLPRHEGDQTHEDEVVWAHSPSILWPDDHGWAIATEIDFDSTLVAGTRALVRELARTRAMREAAKTSSSPPAGAVPATIAVDRTR